MLDNSTFYLNRVHLLYYILDTYYEIFASTRCDDMPIMSGHHTRKHWSGSIGAQSWPSCPS